MFALGDHWGALSQATERSEKTAMAKEQQANEKETLTAGTPESCAEQCNRGTEHKGRQLFTKVQHGAH